MFALSWCSALVRIAILLIDACLHHIHGTIMKAAAKLIELQAGQFIWHGAGTRHSAALHAASTIEQGAVFVRSDSGTVHVLTAQSARQGIAYRVCATDEDSSIFSVPPQLEDIVEAEGGESTTPNTRRVCILFDLNYSLLHSPWKQRPERTSVPYRHLGEELCPLASLRS